MKQWLQLCKQKYFLDYDKQNYLNPLKETEVH